MKKQIVLIDKRGREFERLPLNGDFGPYIWHAGKQWGFATADINGEHFYYEI